MVPTISSEKVNIENDGWNEVHKSRKKKKDKESHESPASHSTFILMLCGIPGSGKSSFAEKLINLNPSKFERISQDVLGTRKKCEKACKEALKHGKVPIIDRCNFNVEQRTYFMMIGNECSVPVDCVVFQYTREVSASLTVHGGSNNLHC